MGVIATGLAPMVYHTETFDVDLDYSVLASHGRDQLLEIAGQMLVN